MVITVRQEFSMIRTVAGLHVRDYDASVTRSSVTRSSVFPRRGNVRLGDADLLERTYVSGPRLT